MAQRIVTVKLIADATGMVQGFAKARDAAAETKARVEDSARNNREAWATVGTTLTAVGVAITGVGAAALRTGIQYNTLQQTSRAALTSLLGSAEAANAQMDKLDDFARNSPFAKQTFITAQQQMLAFGIAAENVIPYLDSIQNAVAAAGGSNNDIAELAEIFGKISASSKITAIDLQQFGRRGIDAASLIGESMGKTGAQIRSEITAGTLDADAALEALATGMTTKFEGASDNVKQTFAGAMDRVKAAWRDFAAELAKPLVDPEGGGALVDLLNWTADAMRNFERLPEPIKATTAAFTGLVGVGSLLLGTAMLAIPKWLEFRDALRQLGVTAGDTRGKLAALAPAAVALLAAQVGVELAQWIDEMRGVGLESDELTRALRNTGTAAREMTRAISGDPIVKLGDDAVFAENNLRALNTGMGQFAGWVQSSWVGTVLTLSSFGQFGRELGHAKEAIEQVDAELAGLVRSGNMREAAAGYEEFAAMARQAGWDQERINEALPEYVKAQEDARAASERGKDGLDSVAQAAKDAVGDLDAMKDALNGIADSSLAMGAAQDQALAAINRLTEAADAEGATLYGTDAASIALRDSMRDVEQAHRDSAVAILENNGTLEEAQAEWQRGRDRIVDMRVALGESRPEAEKWADTNLGSAADVKKAMGEVATAVKNIPTQKHINISTSARQALREMDEIIAKAGQVPANWRPSGYSYAGGSAGGTVGQLPVKAAGFASGGTIPGAGGFVAGGTVYGRGTAKSDSILTRLSVGEEVIQEPFASANRQLLKAINRGELHQGMLQPQVVKQSSGPVRVSLEGARFVMDVDGRAVSGVIREHIHSELEPFGSGPVRAQFGGR